MSAARKDTGRALTAREIVAQKLEQRRAARALTREEKQRVADAHKERGNVHFRKGEYTAAVKCYEDAIASYGPKAAYMNNLAAALLKVGEWDQADTAASWALHRNPKLVKARYRRGIARKEKGNYVSALYDFQTVLKLDPNCKEAKDAIDAIGGPNVKNNGIAQVGPHLHNPRPEDPVSEAETPMPSDSEDYKHKGNGEPCSAYNHDDCKDGSHCKKNHGPDKKSVRDELGRNVCVSYIASACPFPASQCPYTHDKSFINAPKFQNPSHLSAMHGILTGMGPQATPSILETQYMILRGPLEPREWIPRNRIQAGKRMGFDIGKMIASMFGGPEDVQRAEWLEKMETGKGKEEVPEHLRKMYDSMFGAANAKKRRGGGA